MPNRSCIHCRWRLNLTFVAIVTTLSALWSQADAANAMLRVACDGPAINAEVTINGEFKGQCPVDVSVTAGTVRIVVTKKLDTERELYFEQDVRMAASTVKRIDVEFGAPRLNVVAQRLVTQRAEEAKIEAARVAAVRQAQAVATESRASEEAIRVRAAAEAGDEVAMADMGNRYAAGGQGVPKSETEAAAWYRRAASAGNLPADALRAAMRPVKNIEGIEESVPEPIRVILRRMAAQPMNSRRMVDVRGGEAVRALIASDAFFEVDGGDETLNYRILHKGLDSKELSCRRDGRHFQINGVSFIPILQENWDVTMTTILGGLMVVDGRSSRLFTTYQTVLTSIGWIKGQPFPLVPGSHFAISYETQRIGDESSTGQFLACMADPPSSKALVQGLPDTTDMTCYWADSGFAVLYRVRWHANSGCVVPSPYFWSVVLSR